MLTFYAILSFCLIRYSLGQLYTTDADEQSVVTEILDLLDRDSCNVITDDMKAFCCVIPEVMNVFHKIVGLKTITFCEIYKTKCNGKSCDSCSPTCPEFTDEEKELQEKIKNGEMSEEKLIDLLMLDILHENEISMLASDETIRSTMKSKDMKRRSILAMARLLHKK